MISPELPFARLILGIVFVALCAVLTLRAMRKDRKEYQRFKRFRSTVRRQRMYRKWLIHSAVTFGGASVIVLLLAWQHVPLLLDEFNEYGWVGYLRDGFAASEGIGTILVIGFVLALVVGGILAIVAARKVETVPTIGDIQSLLPRNRAELGYGAALSINAGIVEELLFRLAVPALVFGITGNAIVAIVVGLLMFGALHIYQGVVGVVGSTIIGALLMAIYLATGSILAAIVVHALIDLRSLVVIPMIVYKVHRKPASASRHRVAGQRAGRKPVDREPYSPTSIDSSPPL